MNLFEGYLTPSEAAKALGRSVVTLERWRRLRRGPPYFVIEGRPLYKTTDLQAWVESTKVSPMKKGDE